MAADAKPPSFVAVFPLNITRKWGCVMTIQECYQVLGGDFAQVEQRLPSVSLVKRFLAKFPSDGSFSQLCLAMQKGQRADAFRAAHTLKGVSASLGLQRLQSSAEELTELLRPKTERIPPAAIPALEQVKQDYQLTVSTIQAFLASDEP